jgi:hypothetical protein
MITQWRLYPSDMDPSLGTPSVRGDPDALLVAHELMRERNDKDTMGLRRARANGSACGKEREVAGPPRSGVIAAIDSEVD